METGRFATEPAIVRLNDGAAVPQLGLGTGQMRDGAAGEAVAIALRAGYRHIDTASLYGNEAAVGRALARSGVPRGSLFLTTKLCNAAHGYDQALRALDASLGRLGLEQVDLYLIHWPMPAKDRFVETWRALVQARNEGKVRSIGVSNFRQQDIDRIIDRTGVVPAVNQVELHPWLQQSELRGYHASRGIVTQSWSPLARCRKLPGLDSIAGIARKHGRSVVQVVLRWHLQLGLVTFPGASSPAHIAENIDVFDFALDPIDMEVIEALDSGLRIGADPSTFVQGAE